MTPAEKDELFETLERVVDVVAERIARKATMILSQACASPPWESEEKEKEFPREFLTQKEAVAWTGLSVSGLRRARAKGLPSTKALGTRVYQLNELRKLMRGCFN